MTAFDRLLQICGQVLPEYARIRTADGSRDSLAMENGEAGHFLES